jgi:hypothetical protein
MPFAIVYFLEVIVKGKMKLWKGIIFVCLVILSGCAEHDDQAQYQADYLARWGHPPPRASDEELRHGAGRWFDDVRADGKVKK